MSETVQQWLGYDDLPLELAKVFTPRPWKHDIRPILDPDYRYGCKKCDAREQSYSRLAFTADCSVPGRIKIDWNTAIPMLRKVWNEAKDTMLVRDTYTIAADVWRMQYPDKECYSPQEIDQWLWRQASPEQQLIIAALIVAAMAVGRNKQ